jgi:hypothetical protein
MPFQTPLARLYGSLDVVAAVGAFGRKAIVRTAEQAQIFWLSAAALAGGMTVVELQPSGAAAAVPFRVDPAAAKSVTLQHGASSGA